MARSNERGTVLVACMILLALLTLLGAGSLLNATLDTQLAHNQAANKEALYAAEAALEVGVGRVMDEFTNNLIAYAPGALATTPETPNLADGDPIDGADFNGYAISFLIQNGTSGLSPASAPDPYLYTTMEEGQPLMHFAYPYTVEARAVGPDGSSETLSESLRVLETPLVQYYAFFDDDLSWWPGPPMTSWGRVHTNANLYVAPYNKIDFNETDSSGTACPNTITVSGVIRKGTKLCEGVATKPNSVTAGGGSGPVNVEVNGANVVMNTSITAANQASEEARFTAAGVSHVRIGVDVMEAPSVNSLARGGFYDEEAKNPRKPDVDGLRILVDPVMGTPTLQIYFRPNGWGSEIDVTDLVRTYKVAVGSPGVLVDFAGAWAGSAWPSGALVNADGGSATPPPDGSIVYCPEKTVDQGGTYASPAADRTSINPDYPCILEMTDPREHDDVDFTVIDLQRLELWYRDYVAYNTGFGGDADVGNRNLLIYVSRTQPGGSPALGTGGALQAVKLIGSRAGRTRGDDTDRQESPTLTARTTLVTDNPIYLDGDFNAPGASGGNFSPGSYGCAILSDAFTMLSNHWGKEYLGQTSGTYTKQYASDSAYNAAFFSGRYNFRLGGTGGSSDNSEAGIINYPRFVERWNEQALGSTNPANEKKCYITGCLINLWFSQQADSEFKCCNTGPSDVYIPPQRNFGWDVGFANSDYWPPYVPSIFTVERMAWRNE